MAPALVVGILAAFILALWVFVSFRQDEAGVRGVAAAVGQATPSPSDVLAPTARATARPEASIGGAAANKEAGNHDLMEPPAAVTPRPTRNPVIASRVTAVTWNRTPDGTAVTLTTDGAIAPHRVRRFTMDHPPRLVIQIVGIRVGYTPYQMNVATSELKDIRVGFHQDRRPPELHVVLDLARTSGQIPRPSIEGPTITVLVPRAR